MAIELCISGQGPATVFIHGCPTTPDVLAPIADRVAQFATAVQLALPGYGASAPLPVPWTLADLHGAIEATLLERGFGEVALVGFSGGAYHSLALASRGVLRVRRLVSLAGLMTLTAEERAGFRQFAAMIRQGADLRSIAGPRFLSAAFRASHPERVVEVERWLGATTPDNLVAELEAMAASEDLTDRVRALAIPILARVGAEDVAVPPAKSEAIVRAARHGQLQIVPGAGHALTIEDTQATTEAVIAALR
jgi:pimeloyl-ACP methyl ester carboxylesterase